MALPEGLLEAVKAYLNITWQDTATDTKITGYINRGMARLQKIAGASLDFTIEDQPRSLLLDYCRYANSQALEVFETNFQAELLDLNLSTQAPVIDALIVLLTSTSSGFMADVSPETDEGNRYVYQTGTNLTLPERMEVCIPRGTWLPWDGYSDIPATSGQDIMIVEVNSEYKAVRAGKATVN